MNTAVQYLRVQLDALHDDARTQQQLRQRGLIAALENAAIDARVRMAYTQGCTDTRNAMAASIAHELDTIQSLGVECNSLSNLLRMVTQAP